MSAVLPIETDDRFRIITASAGQTVLAISFPWQADRDIKLFKRVDGSWALLANPSAYTLVGAGAPGGGSATLVTPAILGDEYLVLGDSILDRVSSIVRDGRFSSKNTDDEFDRNRIIQQEHSRDLSRAVKVEFGQGGLTLDVDSLADGDTLMKVGNRLVKGANALDIANAQQHAAEATAAAAASISAKDAAVTAAATAVAATVNKADKDLSNAKWLLRANMQGGGDKAFTTTDAYQSFKEGAAQLSYYHGIKIAGAGLALGPLSGGPAGAPGSLTAFEDDVRYSGTLADNNGFLVGHSSRIIATAGFKGGLTHLATTIVRGSPGAAPGNQNYVGLSGQGIAEVNAGGTDTLTGARGAIFGLSGWVVMLNAATNYLDASNEFDLVGEPGATVTHAAALSLCDGAKFRGSQSDALLRLSAYADFAGAGIGRDHMILVTDANSADPTYANSTILGAKFFTNPSTKRVAKVGIDLSAYDFTDGVLRYGQLQLKEAVINLGANVSGVSLIANTNAGTTNASIVIRAKAAGNIIIDTSGGGYLQFGTAAIAADVASNRRVRVQAYDGTLLDLLAVAA